MKTTLKLLALSTLILSACSSGQNSADKIANVSNGKDQAAATKTEHTKPQDPKLSESTGKRGGTLLLSLAGNPKMFNPTLMSDVPSTKLMKGYVFQGLTGWHYETQKTHMLLARSMDVSEDGLQYTFKIRRGIKWSDGHPFSIDDVMFTFQVITDPKILNSTKDLLKQSDGTFPKIERLDDETIRFTIKEVNVLFESAVGATYIIPKHKWEKAYKEGNYMNSMLLNADPKDVVGTGPFMLDRFKSDQLAVLKRNPYYYMYDKNGTQLPYIDKIVRVIAPDFNALLLKFENGEYDMHEVRPEEYDKLKRLEKEGGFTVYDLGPAYLTYYIEFNQNTQNRKDGKPFLEEKKLKVFSDKRFKKAISHAIDREGIVKTAFHGRATALHSFTSPANKKWFNPNIKKYDYSLEKARKLLKEMGLKDSDGDGVLEYFDGSPLKFSIKTNAENHTRIQIGNTIKEDFGKIGLDVSLNPVPFNSLLTTLKDTHDYDAVIMGWGSGIPPDPAMSQNILKSSGRSHQWNPSQKTPATEWEAKIDKLIRKNLSVLDINERKKYYNEIMQIWSEELPQIMIVAPNQYVAIKNHIANTKPLPLRPYFDWNVHELYIKQ